MPGDLTAVRGVFDDLSATASMNPPRSLQFAADIMAGLDVLSILLLLGVCEEIAKHTVEHPNSNTSPKRLRLGGV